tara:strand:+ start:1006 stop:2235 length:1230 start_codon:yes stop_codon:yes gene_type:complete
MIKATPLFPGYTDLKDLRLSDYPNLNEFIKTSPEWFHQNWTWASNFLEYIGRNKSTHTYVRFRNEIERFLLWTTLFHEKPIDQYRKSDILEYIDFCVDPPLNWIGDSPYDRFLHRGGEFVTNPKWRPFIQRAKKAATDKIIDKKKYKPSHETIMSYFVALSSFYGHLVDEDICMGNPVAPAKKDCRHLIKGVKKRTFDRLTDDQWRYVVRAAEELTDDDEKYERSLFIVITMKALFLRISELADNELRTPAMSHFWCDHDNNWWFEALGKGRKERQVTVPESYIPYLKRYRQWRGLTPLPNSGDHTILVEKFKGKGGLTTRQLSRLIQEVFDKAYQIMLIERSEDEARKLQEATTHFLRHTGASQEIERGRPLKDTSEDLGHANMATTDSIYSQTELKKRAESGKNRGI